MEEIVVKLGAAVDARAQDCLDSEKGTKGPSKVIEREIDELRGISQKVQEEAKSLRKQIDVIEEKLSRYIEEAKRQKPTKKTHQFYSEERIQKLEKRLAALEDKPALPVKPEQIVVEPPLTQGTKLVGTPNPFAITETVVSHIPVEKLRDMNSQATLAKATQLSSEPLDASGMPQPSKINILSAGANGFHQVRHGQPFGIHLSFDFTKAKLPNTESLACKVVINAKSLKDGRREIMVEAEKIIFPPPMDTFDVEARASSPGMYRLEAIITFVSSAGEATLHPTSLDGGIIHVY